MGIQAIRGPIIGYLPSFVWCTITLSHEERAAAAAAAAASRSSAGGSDFLSSRRPWVKDIFWKKLVTPKSLSSRGILQKQEEKQTGGGPLCKQSQAANPSTSVLAGLFFGPKNPFKPKEKGASGSGYWLAGRLSPACLSFELTSPIALPPSQAKRGCPPTGSRNRSG
ncbi:hypothetical protein TWF506_006165 [Arthrobotrys conoides]|uniref:Uncharacterized protein n=1 Tax=Arthrobotrys conoides TaxID=74498 RepID=A0AAN8S0C3_9PEZI